MKRCIALTIALACLPLSLSAETRIQAGSVIYITPGDFSTEITAAIIKKKLPVSLTTMPDKADYTLTAETTAQKEGTGERVAKVFVLGAFAGSGKSRDTAVTLTGKDGSVVWAYQTNKAKAQSAAEGVAKHLKDTIK